jgi:hypothetical protein
MYSFGTKAECESDWITSLCDMIDGHSHRPHFILDWERGNVSSVAGDHIPLYPTDWHWCGKESMMVGRLQGLHKNGA